MVAEFPALPLFTDAYLGDTTHLTTFEHGAYLLLLFISWRSPGCCLPDDDALLARYSKTTRDKWRKLRPIIEPFFTVRDGSWHQARLQDEFQLLQSRRDQQREAGNASAAAKALKRNKRGSTVVGSPLQRNVNEKPTPTPTPTPTVSEAAKATSPRASRLAVDWQPGPLPANVAELVTLWPPGREKRELEGFRDYWAARKRDAARCDWDKTWHNRIRDQHDRIMRENRNGHMGRHQSANGISATVAAAIDVFGYPDASDERRVPRGADEMPRLGGPGGHG